VGEDLVMARLERVSKEEALARAAKPAEEAMRLHPFYRGKMQTLPKCAVRGYEDFAVWYTPGVAASCRAIEADPDLVWQHTNRANTIAIVTDGTRVLGLGDIGPEAALPVMEGKALLFKYLGGVDAVPICLATKDADELVHAVELLTPSFGGINLEDIAQPKCFRVLDRLRGSLAIPVWHDDQQGTATALLAGLLNALALVGKEIGRVSIAMIGMGAAGVASYRLLVKSGVDPQRVIACDSKGILHAERRDLLRSRSEYPDKWRVCQETNGLARRGAVAEALRGADVCIAFSASGPGVIEPGWIAEMAEDAVVFACANPIPEIWPWEAADAGARIVATGRSDFPNQLNNSLVFPGLFRGVFDVRARTITDEIASAAARALAGFAQARGISEASILPRMDEWDVHAAVAAAAGLAAQEAGVAGRSASREELYETAIATTRAARESTGSLMRDGLIPGWPADASPPGGRPTIGSSHGAAIRSSADAPARDPYQAER
jgi:malate dehydrogenase (oxaloacetate-decarboxylating)